LKTKIANNIIKTIADVIKGGKPVKITILRTLRFQGKGAGRGV
jgi:hypothetical protein